MAFRAEHIEVMYLDGYQPVLQKFNRIQRHDAGTYPVAEITAGPYQRAATFAKLQDIRRIPVYRGNIVPVIVDG